MHGLVSVLLCTCVSIRVSCECVFGYVHIICMYVYIKYMGVHVCVRIRVLGYVSSWVGLSVAAFGPVAGDSDSCADDLIHWRFEDQPMR